MKIVYLISGPLGVGKSTVAKDLSDNLDECTLIVGDDLYNLEADTDLEWSKKLQIGWSRILVAVKEQLERDKNIVLDFVVEDELHWFMKELSSYDLQFRYVVLLASNETVLKRLENRGELKYKDRSMELLDQLSKDPFNQNFILDTTDKEVPQITEEILNSPRFTVNPA